MALSAIWSLLSFMDVQVTRGTVLGNISILVIEMALFTIDDLMFALKFILALQIMLKGDQAPLISDMTLITGLIELPRMKVLMTVCARGVDRLKMPVFVATITGHREMSAAQLKSTPRVIKERDRP